jgi:hypothetical protein
VSIVISFPKITSSRVDFDAIMKITTDNQEYPEIKIEAMFDSTDLTGNGEVL